MKLSNPEAELQTILTIVSASTPEVRNTLLARLNDNHFGYDRCSEAFKRLRVITASQGSVPSRDVFINDPTLSEEARTLLNKPAVTPLQSLSDLDHLLEQLETARKIRVQYMVAAGLTTQLRKEPPDIQAGATLIEQSLLELRATDDVSTQLHHAGSVNTLDDTVQDILNPDTKGDLIPSTFAGYDKETGGFRKGNLIVIASHHKGGKSTLKLNMLKSQYLLHNCNVCDVTLEMDKKEETERLLASLAMVPMEKIIKKDLHPQERERMQLAWERFKEHGEGNDSRFTIWSPSLLTVQQMELMLMPMGYDVVAVDYVNLLTGVTGPGGIIDAGQLSAFYVALKHMAKRLNCVVIALTQMDERTGDIRYSRSAKEHANVVWVWYYDEAARTTHIITIDQLAARSHRPFKFQLREDFQYCILSDHSGAVYSGDEDEPQSEEETTT